MRSGDGVHNSSARDFSRKDLSAHGLSNYIQTVYIHINKMLIEYNSARLLSLIPDSHSAERQKLIVCMVMLGQKLLRIYRLSAKKYNTTTKL